MYPSLSSVEMSVESVDYDLRVGIYPLPNTMEEKKMHTVVRMFSDFPCGWSQRD